MLIFVTLIKGDGMTDFKLNGSNNELRIEICMLQKDMASITQCNEQLKSAISTDALSGFFIAVIILMIFSFGYGLGKAMS